MSDKKDKRINTTVVHSGEHHATKPQGSVPDIVMSNTFMVDPGVSFSAENLDEDSPYSYTRWSNPTNEILETKVAALEEGEAALTFSSGMAAVAGLFLHKAGSGDRIVLSDVAYAGIREFGNDILSGLNIEVIPVNTSDLDQVKESLQKPTRLVFIDTPSNPILRLADISEIANLAHEAGAELAVDSTFATPIATRPLELGADYVIHSMTKYIGGHGDALGGIVVGRKVDIQKMRQRIGVHMGTTLSPFNAWLINRGLVTLPLRMKAHTENATMLARFLEGHDKIKKVLYPGLPSHPQHDLATKQMDIFSGMITFQVENPDELVQKMYKDLKVIHYAVSLGHHKSLVFYLPTDEMNESSFKLSGKQLEAYKDFAGEGIFRVSVGLEDVNDLCDDLHSIL